MSKRLVSHEQYCLGNSVQLAELKSYIPLDTKQVILETFFITKKLNLTQQKQTTQEQNSLS